MSQISSPKGRWVQPARGARVGRRATLAALALALQCIFLHPLSAQGLDGGVDAAPVRPVAPGVDAQSALAERLRRVVLEVRRADAEGVGPGLPVQGLWVARGRVITAFFGVSGWAGGLGGLVVVGPTGAALEAAVGLQDARIGLAVLDVPGLPAPPGEEVLGVAGAAIGRVVYAVRPGGLRPVPLVGRAEGPRSYYLRGVGAPLPLGTPLFDGGGRWVSFIGVRSDDPELAGYVLPAEAVRGLMARRIEWAP